MARLPQSEIIFKIATEGGARQGDDSDEMTIKKIGTEWKMRRTPVDSGG